MQRLKEDAAEKRRCRGEIARERAIEKFYPLFVGSLVFDTVRVHGQRVRSCKVAGIIG